MIFARALVLLSALGAFAAPVAAVAQQNPPVPAGAAAPAPHHHPNRFVQTVRGLDLSPAQRQQIDRLVAQTRQANRNADPTTRKANRRQLRSQIDAVLTVNQRTRLHAQLRAHRHAAASR